MWILLLLFGISFTIYQVYDRAAYYSSKPTDVGIRVEYVNEIRFPTVTVCNENRAQRTSTFEYGKS
jgi:Amiloride-sensitive sodium channel